MRVRTNRILNDTKQKKRKIRSLFQYLDICYIVLPLFYLYEWIRFCSGAKTKFEALYCHVSYYYSVPCMNTV